MAENRTSKSAPAKGSSCKGEREKVDPLPRRSDADRSLLVISNLPFVVSVASRYRGHGVPLEDLVSEGCLGLIEAAGRFDPDRGFQFMTYARWWVRKSILGALGERLVVKIPTGLQTQIRRARAQKAAAENTATRPGGPDVNDELALAFAALDDLVRTTSRNVYLSDVLDSESRRGDDLIADQRSESVEHRLIRDESQALIEKASGALRPAEWRVIRSRFGLGGTPAMTLKEIADDMSISRERVRQIEREAKSKLRRALFKLNNSHHRRIRGR